MEVSSRLAERMSKYQVSVNTKFYENLAIMQLVIGFLMMCYFFM